MNWGQVALNLVVMAVVYTLGYCSSYFFSKKYAEKRAKEGKNKDEKQK